MIQARAKEVMSPHERFLAGAEATKTRPRSRSIFYLSRVRSIWLCRRRWNARGRADDAVFLRLRYLRSDRADILKNWSTWRGGPSAAYFSWRGSRLGYER